MTDSDNHQHLLSKVLKMLGKEDSIDKFSLGQNGGIVIEIGKPNIEKFIKMAMDY